MANFNFNQIKSELPAEEGDDTVHTTPAPASFDEFNKRVPPIHPQTYLESELTDYQKTFYELIEASGRHRFHINKGRQMGFSELMLRIVAYRGFTKYAGRGIKIIAGTRSTATKKLIDRLKALFRTGYPDWINKPESQHDLRLVLTNGTTYEGLPANPEAITGDTKIACIIMDEAAKWDLIDDQPVLNSIMPIVKTNRSDLFMLSTPKGPRGFFYEIEQEHDESEWHFFKYSIYDSVGNLYTKEEVDKMLKDPTIDVDQEFRNQYTTGRGSIFGNEFPTGEHEPSW